MAATGATLQPPTTRVQSKRMLPYGWPLFVAFGLFPVWYLLGFGALMWFPLAIPMTFSLVARSRVRIPRGFGLFMLFFIWMLATVIQLQGSGTDRLFGFAYRAGLYYSAGVWCLYIYNAPKRLLTTRTVLKALTWMWIVVVAGGWLGIASPTMEFSTLAEKIIPQGLQNNDLVYTLIHPKVAEVQKFLGYDVARPQAPFDFSNNWGANFALLLPFVCAFWGQLRTLARRNLLRLVAVFSMIPVVFSLNRTLWLCLIVTLVYGGARFAMRSKGKGGFQAITAVAIIAYLMFTFGPVGKLIQDRAATNHSGAGRALLYDEATDSVRKSPLLGYGAPRASQRNPNLPPVGTQGHFWLVFFSHGFPGMIFFVAFVGSAMWRTRRARTAAALWCHITLLLAMIMMPFYGLFHMQIHIVAIAFALASREMVDPDEPTKPAEAPKARAYVVSTVRTDRAPALTGAGNGNGNGNGNGHSNGNGNGHSNGNGNGHSPGTGMTPWGPGRRRPRGLVVTQAGPLAVAPPSTGLDWACHLLFESGGRVVARRRGQAAPAGFGRAEAYLALPRAANPRLLVPLGSPRAAAAALARNHDATSKKARLARAALGAGLRVGLTQRLADRVDVFADPTLSAAERPAHLLSDHLRAVFGRPDLEMAVILGVPRLNRKPVLQVLASDGTVVGYVKAAWNDLTAALVRNEARVLADLGAARPTSFTPPTLVAAGPWRELELICASALPNAGRPDAAQIFDPPMDVIAEIAGRGGRSTARLADSPYWAGVRERLATQNASEVLRGAVDWIERHFGAVEMAFGTWHGDFTPWNMARLGDATYLWDWERAAPAPAGLDLLHFLFQTQCRFGGGTPERSVEICSERTPSLLPSLEVPLASERALWLVYRLELLFRYDEAREAGVLARPSKIHAGILEMFARDMEAG